MSNREWLSMVELIQRAHAESWAIGQFNMSGFDTMKGIVEAALDIPSPVVVGVSPRTVDFIGIPYLKALIRAVRETSMVPIYFHLDHGVTFSMIEACIQAGFDSVMIDASSRPLEENIEITRQVVALAHQNGVGVEAQVGQTWHGDQEEDSVFTDPQSAQYFVRATGIDYLAVSVGETPGKPEGQSHIFLDRLREVARSVSVPLVLHGGTSIDESQIVQAIQCGVSKINIDTAIRKAATEAMREIYRQEDPSTDLRIPLSRVREATKAVVFQKTHLFGSAQRTV